MKTILLVALFLSAFLSHSQSMHTEKKGVVVNVALSTSRGFVTHGWEFDHTNGSELKIVFPPGSGAGIGAGVGLWLNKFDFELQFDQTFLAAYSASASGSSGLQTGGYQFHKTNVYGTAYVKFPGEGKVGYRLGLGTWLVMPGNFVLKIDGDEVGRAVYRPTFGGLVDGNMVIRVKEVCLIPGLRIKIGQAVSSNMTFDQHQDSLDRFDVSAMNVYFALAF